VNWAYTLLGVSPDAEVGDVKRAYARLLRKTRPDEDADGFQQLHMAYRLVLAQVTARTAGATVQSGHAAPPASHDPPSVPTVSDRDVAAIRTTAEVTVGMAASTPSPAEDVSPVAAVNPTELVNRVIQYATANNEDRKLSVWLSKQPEFWSIRTKQQIGQLLLSQLFRNPQPMASACLDTLLQFFDLEQVLSGINPIALAQLRRRQLAMWYLLPENDRAFASRLNISTKRLSDRRQLASCLRLLQGPWRWQSVPWPAIRRGRVVAVGRLIHTLCSGHLAELPPQIDRANAAFWYRAALTGVMSRPRFAVGSVRAGFMALILMTGVVGVATLTSWANGDGLHVFTALGIGAVMAANILGIWLVYAGWIWLDHWQGLPESSQMRPIWLRRMLIPALCAAAIGLDYLATLPVAAIAVIGATLIMALRRFQHRSPPRPAGKKTRTGSTLPGVFFLFIVLANMIPKLAQLPEQIPIIAIGAMVPMAIWMADMWRHRFHFKRKATA
jgi:hypothetical protein